MDKKRGQESIQTSILLCYFFPEVASFMIYTTESAAKLTATIYVTPNKVAFSELFNIIFHILSYTYFLSSIRFWGDSRR